jgi:cysteine desulfurase/selenocysteine lyase
VSRDAWEATRAYWDDQYQNGDRHWNDWMDAVERTRAKLSRLIGALPEEVAFVSNTSQAMNLIADLFPRDLTVILADDDFPSVTLPWIQRAHRTRFIQAETDGVVHLGAIRAAIREASASGDRAGALVAVSSVQYRTGFRFDLEGLGEICSEFDAPLIVDATQGFGVFPLDVDQTSISAMAFSAYKWLGAGYGVATVYVRKEILSTRPLPAVGWRSAREPYRLENRRLDLTKEARGLELGHPPFPGILALGGSIELLERIGLSAIAARVQSLVSSLLSGFDRRRITVLSPRDPVHRSGIVMVGVTDPTWWAAELGRRGVFVSARGRALRVSVHFYNDEGDLARFFEIFDEIRTQAPTAS